MLFPCGRSLRGSAVAGQFADQLSFAFTVGAAVRVKHFMEPDRRLLLNIRMVPGFPWQVCLRFADYESPVDGADVVFLGDGQNGVKGAADGTRHEFGADHRTIQFLQCDYTRFEDFGPTVVVEGNDVRLTELRTHGGRPLGGLV